MTLASTAVTASADPPAEITESFLCDDGDGGGGGGYEPDSECGLVEADAIADGCTADVSDGPDTTTDTIEITCPTNVSIVGVGPTGTGQVKGAVGLVSRNVEINCQTVGQAGTPAAAAESARENCREQVRVKCEQELGFFSLEFENGGYEVLNERYVTEAFYAQVRVRSIDIGNLTLRFVGQAAGSTNCLVTLRVRTP